MQPGNVPLSTIFPMQPVCWLKLVDEAEEFARKELECLSNEVKNGGAPENED
jgi:hypothetical protein